MKALKELFESIPTDMKMSWNDYIELMEFGIGDLLTGNFYSPAPVSTPTPQPAPTETPPTIAPSATEPGGWTSIDSVKSKPVPPAVQKTPIQPPQQPQSPPMNYPLPEVPHYSLNGSNNSGPTQPMHQEQPEREMQPNTPAYRPMPETNPIQPTPGALPGNSAYIRQYMDTLRRSNTQRRR